MQTDVVQESQVTDREPETAVSANLQKIKPFKNQHFFLFFLLIFYFIKSQTIVTHLSIITMVILHT